MKESRLWFWHLVSGLALLLLLGLHTTIMHFDSVLTWMGLVPKEAWAADGGGLTGALNFAHSVLPRMKSVSMTVVYLMLMGFGLFHGLYGLRSIIYELKLARRVRKAAGFLVLLAGIGFGIYGTVTILQGHLNAPLVQAQQTASPSTQPRPAPPAR